MKKFLIAGILAFCAATGFSQGVGDVVINEILVRNVDNYEDDYGHRVAWIELYNNGYSNADLASCYLTMQVGDQTVSYRIPKNDTRTALAPQGYTVFFCEGTATKGTFHTNFLFDLKESGDSIVTVTPEGDTLRQAKLAGQSVSIALLEANGKDTIDKVTFDLADQLEDVSIGRLTSESGETTFTALESTTPYATNNTIETLPAHEKFRRTDPIGYGMAITAMSVVLVALLLLYLLFRTVGKVMSRKARKQPTQDMPATKSGKGPHFTGEEIAAIALALNMYENDLHDQESTILTINRVAKAYSPWNSKIYGLTQMPERHTKRR